MKKHRATGAAGMISLRAFLKRVLPVLMAAVMAVSLAACKSPDPSASDGQETESGAQAQTASAETGAEGSGNEDAAEAATGDSALQSLDDIEFEETPYVREDGGVSMDIFAMDTYMTLLAYGDRAEDAVLAAAAEIHSLDDLLSTGSADSEVSMLNAAGGGEVSPVVQELIERSLELNRETGGLFDIAIYPVMKLWGFPTQDYRVPDQAEIEEALLLADASEITLETVTEPVSASGAPEADGGSTEESAETAAAAGENAEKSAETAKAAGGSTEERAETAAENTTAAAETAAAADTAAAAAAPARTYTSVSFGIPGMEIDLGGIAKGYTSSRVMEVFREYGIEHGLVSLGGNVQATGNKENGNPWRVAIQDPEEEMEYIGILEIADKCVITSGGYERFFEEDGKRYHHIIDPRTGFPADSGIISSTIISDDGTLADGLSTSLFIMGEEAAEEYWRAHADAFDFILEDADGTLYVTEGADELLTTDHRTVVIER